MKNKLAKAENEKDVENTYRAELLANLKNSQITSPFGCDGLLEAEDVRSLLEFKFDKAMKTKLAQCGVLIQVLYYLKKFEDSGERLPSTIFVGDVNECFALKTNSIAKYLSHDIDWQIAPSAASEQNPALVKAMVDDVDILPFVFDVDDKFHIRLAIEKIKDLSGNVVRKVRVTEHNIATIFEYFSTNVLGEKVKLSTNEKANLFVQIIINPNENCLHPKKKNVLMTKSFGEVAINRNLFLSFFGHFEGEVYSPRERERLTGFVDRLVEDTTRRRKGEFYTPTLFVDEAHKYIAKAFGENWKDEYVVWDSCCGTGNLTRDYKFKELYMSTLEQSDIDTANQMGYNPEAVKFQYDFLNDGVGEDMFDESALPEGLAKAINEGKKILFLINPPYATAKNGGSSSGNSKAGVAKTKTGERMKAEGWGACSQNLYAQFLYNIWRFNQVNKNVKIALFCSPLFMSGGSYNAFRKYFFDSFGFKNGFLFEAAHFSDCAKGWGVSFTNFTNESNNKKFLLDVVDVNDSFFIQKNGEKEIYNTDADELASDWVRKEVKGIKSIDAPPVSSCLTVKEDGVCGLAVAALGYMNNGGNNVQQNMQVVGIYSSCYANGHGFSIVSQNIAKVTTFFSARRLIANNWVNHYDEYLAPDEQHPEWEQFVNDSLVYSLFESKSNQSSLRQIEYKGKLWDIKNEFFWLSRKEMMELANEAGYDALYRDAKAADERFVYKKLFGAENVYAKLSPDAKAVLDAATELLKKSIAMRQAMSEEHPEYHLDTFDAGYAQLKLVWKEYFKEEFEKFRALYKAFEDRMRPLVYKLGFLKE